MISRIRTSAFALALTALALGMATTNALAQPAEGSAPILAAAFKGDLASVQKLLAEGADVNTRDAKGDTPLIWAADQGKLAVATLLIEKKADVNARGDHAFTALNWAAYQGHPALVKLLVENKAEIDVHGNSSGWTPLMNASAMGHLEIVTYLIEHRADVRLLDAKRYSALSHAAAKGKSDIVRLLLGHGADGKDSLFFMVRNVNIPAITLLLDSGVNVNAGDKTNETALYKAAEGNKPDVMALLLARGADPSQASTAPSNMTTPLMWAAYHCNGTAVQLLRDRGALRSATNQGRETAYDLARTGWTSNMKPCPDGIVSALSP